MIELDAILTTTPYMGGALHVMRNDGYTLCGIETGQRWEVYPMFHNPYPSVSDLLVGVGVCKRCKRSLRCIAGDVCEDAPSGAVFPPITYIDGRRMR